MSKIVKSEWLLMIDNLIRSALSIEKIYRKQSHLKGGGGGGGANVLIYCKNGQIGSAVLSSLAQLLIEPYYRTREGFRILIMKEWIYFGHNFVKYLNLCNDYSEGKASFCPVFVLFLDCVH